jgi:hypothetical protein
MDGPPQVLAAFERDLETLRASFASHYDEDRDRIERTFHPVYPVAGRRFRVIGHARNQGLTPPSTPDWLPAAGPTAPTCPATTGPIRPWFSRWLGPRRTCGGTSGPP